ncbi:sliding clamp DNA polymerase accessory protein [Synechococcus phage S-N03]|uniref:Sliding clamp n=1 Tax=Synechococcus phage S-N03 TaxID=2718943 RepID=A0A6G8R5T2_9CAUD|nr:sliding clamp DNA polymerase accessory protein [Synechococcus phage S-N03]QIN96741.1 sliding clamp DNA polymerase accessory protein [Synechococcus phage S-N03]
MKLSADTVALLKNFSSINQSILIRSGKVLKTMSVMKNILVSSEIPEEFDRDVAIYDLNQFLNCLSLVEGAEITLEENAIVITNGTDSIEYRYSDPSVIGAPPEKELVLPSEDVCVVLTEEQIQTVKKAAAVLQIPDVSLVGDGEKIFLTVRDKKNSGSNSYKIEVGETEAAFQFNLKVENLKLLAGDYDVIISKANLAKFTNHSRPAVYFLALEPDSTFEG